MASIDKFLEDNLHVQFFETSVVSGGESYYLVKDGKMDVKRLRELVKMLYKVGKKAGRNQVRAAIRNTLLEE